MPTESLPIQLIVDEHHNVARFTLTHGCTLRHVIEVLEAMRAGVPSSHPERAQYWDCETLDTATLIALLKDIDADLSRWLRALGPPVRTALVFASEGQRSLVEAVRGTLGQPDIWRVFADSNSAERWFYSEVDADQHSIETC